MRAAGASAARAERLALEMAGAGAAGLVSFGIAGGLDPALAPGTLVLADAIVPPDGNGLPTDPAWRRALGEALAAGGLAPHSGTVAGSDAALTTAAGKAALFATTGACIVDMESHGVARAAGAAGLACIVLRAVADPAGRALPPAALAGLRPDGGIDVIGLLAALVKDPRQIPGLVALAGNARAATAALSGAVACALTALAEL